MSDLPLTHNNPKHLIIVVSQACDYGTGALLLRKFPDGIPKTTIRIP